MSTYSPSELQWSQYVLYFLHGLASPFWFMPLAQFLMVQFLFLKQPYLLLTLKNLWNDLSVLDYDKFNPNEELNRKIDRIVSAGMIEETSRVLVSISSEEFVDRLVDSSPCKFLLVVHDSLLMLAGIKEKYDLVKCWQGEIIYVPEKWAPSDVVFLYSLPALPFKLDEILGSLAEKCSLGWLSITMWKGGYQSASRERSTKKATVTTPRSSRS